MAAQVSGVKNIPGDYPSIAAAITDLNTVGVGVGGATIRVAAGHTETAANLTLSFTVNPSSEARPLAFVKNGVGANPLVTADVGTSTTTDGIIKLAGADYVTFDGINLQENAANTTATTQMEWGYALVKASATNGCQNVTIKNCTVTLSNANTASVGIYSANHTATVTTGLTVTSFAGTNSYNQFLSNTIQNAYTGYVISGFSAGAPYDLFDQKNKISQDAVSNLRSQVVAFGGGAIAAYGVNTNSQNDLLVEKTYFNNAGAPPSTGILGGINIGAAINASVSILRDTLTLASNATTSTFYAIANTSGSAGAGNKVEISENVVTGCTYSTATTGAFRGIFNGAAATTMVFEANTVSNNTHNGSGEFAGIYNSGSSATLVLNVSASANTISNNSKNGATGNAYFLYMNGASRFLTVQGNLITNNSASATSGTVNGYYNFSTGLEENIQNNLVSGLAGGSGEVVGIVARTGSGQTDKLIFGNVINGITGSSSTSPVGGLWVDYAATARVYANQIFNIQSNTATGGAPAAFGINVGSNNNVDFSLFNNFISDIKAPTASQVEAVYGIWMQGSTSTNARIYHNTVALNATSTGANFGTAALVMTSGNPISIDVRNNILVNISTANGTGLTRAIRRGVTALTNYSLLSGYNCLYAGTPSAVNVIFSDGTTSYQTIQDFRNGVTPRDQSSFSEMPPFFNLAGNDLHLDGGVPTQCERGGQQVGDPGNDFDGNFRSTWDVGADEFAGLSSNTAPPNIQYVPLTNASVGASRSLPNFADITDGFFGINVTPGTCPRIYYKRSTDANTYVDNTSATNGWKYTEALPPSYISDFNIDYSKLFGGAVVAGDVIQYFVTAQDISLFPIAPIVGRNSGAFASVPADVNLTSAHFPITGTINQYTIVANSYSGTINVGPTETITSLTNAGGLFERLNTGVLSGNLLVRITGNLTAETGTFALNQLAEEGGAGYTVTISPATSSPYLISGSNLTAALIRLDGADRVIIDGSISGLGRNLTFRNTSNAAPTIGMFNDAVGNAIQNVIVESGNTATSATLGGAILIGPGLANGTGNDFHQISGCEIRDRSDVQGTPAIGIQIVGSNTGYAQYNNNITISNNDIHDWFLANSASQFGVFISSGNTTHSISGNSFYQTAIRTQTASGAITRAININFSSAAFNTGMFGVTGNYIGGTGPQATGGDMTYTVSGTNISQSFSAISVASGQLNNDIVSNTITKIDYTTQSPASPSSVVSMIFVGQGVHNVASNVIGGFFGNDLIKVRVNAGSTGTAFSSFIFSSSTNGYSNIFSNTIGGITHSGTSTANVVPQYIQIQGTPSQQVSVSGNVIGSTTTSNSNQLTSATTPVVSFGIRSVITSGAFVSITGNTIANLSNASTNANTSDYGILAVSTVGGRGEISVNQNTVRDMTSQGAPGSAAFALTGIALQGLTGGNTTVSANTVGGLYLLNPSATSAGFAVGIQVQGNTLGGTMEKNRIFDIRNVSTSGLGGLAGLYISSSERWHVKNNMISLSNGAGSLSNPVTIYGIVDASVGSNRFDFNSVYLGGNAGSGALNTYSFLRGSSGSVNLKNNLLYNERSSTGGFNYAIGNLAGTPSEGWNPGFSNNNFFVTSDAARVGEWGNGVGQTLAQWRASSAGDDLSKSSLAADMPSVSLFNATSTGELKINSGYYLTPSYLESQGVVIPGVNSDFEYDTRPGPAGSVNGGGTNPDIGADEFDGTPALLDIADFAWIHPDTVGCHGAADSVVVQIKNTGTLPIDLAASPVTVRASVTGPNPVVFAPVVVNTGTLAVGATQNVVISSNYDMSFVGTYVFSSDADMPDDGNSANDTLIDRSIVVSGGITGISASQICLGDTSALNVAGYTLGGSIQWQDSTLGGVWNNILGANTPNLVVSPSDTTWYRAIVCGLHASTVTELAIVPAPVVGLGADTLYCSGSILLDAGLPGSSYLWSTSDTTQTISVSTLGSYSVQVTNSIGCVGADTLEVLAGTVPAVFLGTDSAQCGGTVVLDAGNPGAAYLWSTSASTQTVTVSTTGSYFVDVLNPGAGCVGSDTVNITINAAPAVSFNFPNDTICKENGIVALTGETPTGGTWSGTGVTGSNFDPNALSVGFYTVTYTYTDILTGCFASASDQIYVDICTGIAPVLPDWTVSLYPNPNQGNFVLEVGGLSGATFSAEIFSAEGKRVWSNVQPTVAGEFRADIDLTQFSTGVFMVKVMVGEEVRMLRVVTQ